MTGPMLRGLAFVVDVLALMLTAAVPCWAAGASVSGRVTKLDGTTPIPGARVTIVSQDLTKNVAVADAVGVYVFENLPAGNHYVFAEAPDFWGVGHILTLTEGLNLFDGSIPLAPGSTMDFKGTSTVNGSLGSFPPGKWLNSAVSVGGVDSGLLVLPDVSRDALEHAVLFALNATGNENTPSSSSQTVEIKDASTIREIGFRVGVHAAHFLNDVLDIRIAIFADFLLVLGRSLGFNDALASGSPGDSTGDIAVQLETVYDPFYGIDKRATMFTCLDSACKNFKILDRLSFPGRQNGVFLYSQDKIETTLDGRVMMTTIRQYAGRPQGMPETIVFSPSQNLQPPSTPFAAFGASTGSVPADPNASVSIAVSFSDIKINGQPRNLAGTPGGPRVFMSPGPGTYPKDSVSDLAVTATDSAGAIAAFIDGFVNENPAFQNLALSPQPSGVAALRAPDVNLGGLPRGSAGTTIGIGLTGARRDFLNTYYTFYE